MTLGGLQHSTHRNIKTILNIKLNRLQRIKCKLSKAQSGAEEVLSLLLNQPTPAYGFSIIHANWQRPFLKVRSVGVDLNSDGKIFQTVRKVAEKVILLDTASPNSFTDEICSRHAFCQEWRRLIPLGQDSSSNKLDTCHKGL